MNGQFNAIDYAQQLEAAGVPQAQAEVHAKMLALALVSCAASRADLASLGREMSAEISAFRSEFLAEISALNHRMDEFEARTISRMEAFEARTIAKMEAFEANMVARMEAFELRVKLELAGMRTEIAELRAELRSAKKMFFWMFATNTSLVIAVLVKQFFP